MRGVSIVIRTKNEGRCLGSVLKKISLQEGDFAKEVIIVDSGSTDDTLNIARKYGCRIIHVLPGEFTWGFALNKGLETASNEYCVLLSGHCVPVDNSWLDEITRPLSESAVAAVCGRQIPIHGLDPFEEVELTRWFPEKPQNTSYRMFTSANSSLKRSLWQNLKFDECLNSLEDEELSRRLRKLGYAIRYVPTASVFHSHPLSLSGVYRRWYWRMRVGMYLRRKNESPGIRLTSESALPSVSAFITTGAYFARYFVGSVYLCFKKGYISYLWKLPFYEMVRQYSIYRGLKDGLMDVKRNEPVGHFSYFEKEVPKFVSALRFIEG